MPPQDLLQALRRQPFAPFRIHVADGTVYDVHHPELVMVGLASAVVGVPAQNQPSPVYERYETVDLRHVVRLVPLPAAKTAGNGQ
jgi:hypothetical protein